MADKLDFKQYKEAYSKIQLTEKQKNILIVKASESKKPAKNNPLTSHGRSQFICFILKRAVPCFLVFVLLSGCIFVYTNYINSKNTFSIVASAAELPDSEQSDTVIGIFSDSGMSEFAMNDFGYVDENNPLYNNHLINEQGKIDYFCLFALTELNVVGKNIKEVTFKANKKFTYFSIEPLYQSEKELDEVLEMFSDYESIENSQYSRDEGDGFFAETGRCDGFTYINPNIDDEEQTINLGEYLNFVVESDRTDKEIDEAVSNIEEVYSAYELVVDTEKGEAKTVKVSEKSDAELDNQLEKNIGILCEKTLQGATIDVTVKFADNSTQTKVIKVDFYQKIEDGIYYSPEIILGYAD